MVTGKTKKRPSVEGGSGVRIPRMFRRPMSARKYRKLNSMLSDRKEKDLMDRVFIESGNLRIYTSPKDSRTAKKAAGILKKVKKARQGPRVFRIGLLAAIILAPILFNLLFLDSIAARRLEKTLESLSGTDVAVQGLDISPARGRVDLDRLAFASVGNPMKDSAVLSSIALDFSIRALFFRRLNIDALSGNLEFDQPRATAASYPQTSRDTGTGRLKSRMTSVGFDWMPVAELRSGSAELAENLLAENREELEQWQQDLGEDRQRIESLVGEVREFVDRGLPGRSDIPGWMSRLEEGRALAAELKGLEMLASTYRSRLNSSLDDLESIPVRVQEALEKDLAALEESFRPDRDLVNLWVQAALEAYLGPNIAEAYRRAGELAVGFGARSGSGESGSAPGKQNPRTGRRRMKTGRIVAFPVQLPPRFTIADLNIGGPGVEIQGSGLGTDHDLAGRGSELAVRIEDVPSLTGSYSLDIAIDGRTGAERFLSGTARIRNLPWGLRNGDTALSGQVGLDAEFVMDRKNQEYLRSQGRAGLSGWNGGEGNLAFIADGTPALGFNYEARLTASGIQNLTVNIEPADLRGWIPVLAKQFLPDGTAEARKRLEEAVGSELEGLDNLNGDWASGAGQLNGLENSIGSADSELEKTISELAEGVGGRLPTGSSGGVLDGLKSLF